MFSSCVKITVNRSGDFVFLASLTEFPSDDGTEQKIWKASRFSVQPILDSLHRFRQSHPFGRPYKGDAEGEFFVGPFIKAFTECFDELVEKISIADDMTRSAEGNVLPVEDFHEMWGCLPYEVILPDGWVELKKAALRDFPHN